MKPIATAVMVNPRSANARTWKRWPVIEQRIRETIGDVTVLVTERPGHATDLTRAALEQGHTRIVSVGGDGTHHEVLNGFFQEGVPVNPAACIAIIPQGTGSDLARTLNLRTPQEGIAALSAGKTVAADVGRVVYTRPDGSEATGYFLNTAHFGMGGVVVARVNRTTKACGGFLSFLWGVTATLMTYKGSPMILDIDGTHLEQPCLDVIVANGRYDGGGMLVAPEARLDSGVFEVYVIGDIGRMEAFRNLPTLYRGALKDRPDLVQHFKASRIAARSEVPVLLNLEGEQPGQLPLTIDLLPRALNLVSG